MEDYRIVPEGDFGEQGGISCRAASVEAALRRAARLMAPGWLVEIWQGGRCVYRGSLRLQAG